MSDKINISVIKYNTVFEFLSDQDPWKRLGAKGTFSEQNNLTKNRFVNLSECIWVFSDFFLIFEQPVYEKCLSRTCESFQSIIQKLLERSA